MVRIPSVSVATPSPSAGAVGRGVGNLNIVALLKDQGADGLRRALTSASDEELRAIASQYKISGASSKKQTREQLVSAIEERAAQRLTRGSAFLGGEPLAARLLPRPFSKAPGGKRTGFILDDGTQANVSPIDDLQTQWLWDDGLVTDQAGNPIAGPVRNEAGEVTGYVDAAGKPVVKEAYDMLLGDGDGSGVMPDSVAASDPAGASIEPPDVTEVPELDMSAPDDPNVDASAPTVATPSPERSAQIARLRRDIFQVGGDLENPSLDYPVSQDDINRLATAISDLTPAEMAAFSADPTLNKRMELVFDSSNNQPAADASMRPGQADNERADEFLDLENAPLGSRRGGAELEARAKELGLSQADLPIVFQKRSPTNRSYETRASSPTEKDPGSRALDENGNPVTIITDQRLARDTPMAQLRALIETMAGYKPEAKRFTRLRVGMNPAERVAAGDLDAGLFDDITYDGPQGSGLSSGLPQDRGVQSYRIDPQTGQPVPDVYRSVEAPDSLGAQTQEDVKFLQRALIKRRLSTGRILRQLQSGLITPDKARQMLAAPRGTMPSLMDEIRDLESRLQWATSNAPLMARDIPADGSLPSGSPTSATPDSSLVAVDPDDMATFPGRRRDSGGRVPFSRRADAAERMLSVDRKLTLPEDAIERNRDLARTRRYTDGLTTKLDPGDLRNTRTRRVQMVVPGLIGKGGMVSSPMEFALMAAERAGMNLNGPVSQPFLDEIVKVYNSVYGDYAPLRPREFAEAIARIEGPTAQAADNAVSVPGRSAELSLSPEQLDQFRDLLVRVRDAVAIDHPGFGAVTWDPETRAWQIDASGPTNFVVDPSGNVVPTSRGIDSESIARQAAADVPEDELEPPVPTKGIGGPSRRRIPAQTGAQGGSPTPGDVAGDTPTPPPGIPSSVDGSTPTPPPGIGEVEIDNEIERFHRDWFNSSYPGGTAKFPDWDSYWASNASTILQSSAARSAAAARLGGSTPGSAAASAGGATPAAPGATPAGPTPSPTPAAGGGGAGGQPPNIPPGAAGATPGTPQGPTPAAAGGGAGGQPPNIPPGVAGANPGQAASPNPQRRQLRDLLVQQKKNRQTSAKLAAGLGTTAALLTLVNQNRAPSLADMAERAGGGVDPFGPPGGLPPGGMPPGGGGVDDGFSDPLANDRAFQMARALQLIQAGRVPQYQTAQNPIGYEYRP